MEVAGWECKLVQPLWKIVQSFLRKLKIELSYDLTIPLLGIYADKTIIQKGACTSMFITARYGHEFEQAPGVADGQGSLVCCSPWGRKELDTTERLNRTASEGAGVLVDFVDDYAQK